MSERWWHEVEEWVIERYTAPVGGFTPAQQLRARQLWAELGREKKIAIIKELRADFQMSLKDAKDLAELAERSEPITEGESMRLMLAERVLRLEARNAELAGALARAEGRIDAILKLTRVVTNSQMGDL